MNPGDAHPTPPLPPRPPLPPALPGEGPLLGESGRFRPERLRPALLARESSRLAVALEEITARKLEVGWGNPPIAGAIAALGASEREALLLAPDFRRWVARIIRATHPQSAPDAALPVQVQAVWNQLAIPWLRGGAGAGEQGGRGELSLLVFRDGTVPLPGSGLVLEGAAGRRVRLVVEGEELRMSAENGALLAQVERRALLAAAGAAGAPAAAAAPATAPTRAAATPALDPPWRVAPRADGIELSGAGTVQPEFVAQVADALSGLRRAWPGGAIFVHGLVQRIELDPNPELNSKTVSELPGLVILGRHAMDPGGAAELLVHEATHLLVYEMARLQAVLPAPEEMRHSPFSRADARPAYMVLHGTASFCAQAITTARWSGARSSAEADPALASRLQGEFALLKAGEAELEAHLGAHGESPHAFVAALFEEISLLARWLAEERR